MSPTESNIKGKAYVYVTRGRGMAVEVLVFTQEMPLLREAYEIPGGTMDPGEAPADSARREVLEEAGDVIDPQAELVPVGHYDWFNPWTREMHRRYFFHVEARPGLPDRFTHVVLGEGYDAGRPFAYRWLPLSQITELAYDFGTRLGPLHERLGLSAPSGPFVRLASPEDLPAINRIFNGYVTTSPGIYTDQPWTDEQRQSWYEGRDFSRHPVTVAEEAGEVVGFAALSPLFLARGGYRFTAENSVYVREGRLGRGVGKLLLADLLDRAWRGQLHSVVALIDSEQTASLALHRRLGFVEAGRLREAGFKLDQWRSVFILQRMIETR